MADLIYNQHRIPKDLWHYGFRSSAAVGCGWIATYNALVLLGHPQTSYSLIRYYERQLPLIHGNLGTTVLAPAIYFKQHGFPVTVTSRRRQFDAVAKQSDVSILFYHWRSKWKLGAHFVAAVYTDRGFSGYNTYHNSTGQDFYGESLDSFLTNRHYFGAVLIGIRNKAC